MLSLVTMYEIFLQRHSSYFSRLFLFLSSNESEEDQAPEQEQNDAYDYVDTETINPMQQSSEVSSTNIQRT